MQYQYKRYSSQTTAGRAQPDNSSYKIVKRAEKWTLQLFKLQKSLQKLARVLRRMSRAKVRNLCVFKFSLAFQKKDGEKSQLEKMLVHA